jgi:hypothetical protein
LQITGLSACPLLEIFASSSVDRTVKLWDYGNELIRELVFEGPISDCLFFTDYGQLMVAIGPALL